MRALRWHEEEASFCWSGGTRHVMKTKTRGTKATDSSDVLEPLDTSQAAVCRTAVGMFGCIIQDRPFFQHASGGRWTGCA